LQSELKAAPADANENGKADNLVLFLAGNQNWVALLAYFDDTSSESPFGRLATSRLFSAKTARRR
jgi:hypothetical protein